MIDFKEKMQTIKNKNKKELISVLVEKKKKNLFLCLLINRIFHHERDIVYFG